MSLFSRISDTANLGIGTFISAPGILAAGGITPTDKAIEALLQGLVGIILMIGTKLVAKFFDKKKEAAPASQRPALEAQPESLTLNNNTDGNEKSSQ